MVSDTGPLLEIEGLTVSYQATGSRDAEAHGVEAVRDVSLQVHRGETLGLVGESGSGKTTLALAVMRYLPHAGMVVGGSVRFAGDDLLALGPAALRSYWGNRMALVPQDARSSLNPTLRLGDQAAEILQHHAGLGREAAHQQVLALFDRVRLADPERVARAYPHQLSGGMLQRVLIAMALSTEPELLILDEPTSSLDVTTQAAILDLVRELIAGRRHAAVLYITHNLGVIAQIGSRVAVMYAGELVEDAPTQALYRHPLHPYTRGLLDCVPRLGTSKYKASLRPIQGRIPSLGGIPEGCVFEPRCPLAIDICATHPPLYQAGDDRRTRCHRWEGIRDGQLVARQPEIGAPHVAQGAEGPVVLDIEDLQVHFAEQRSLANLLQGKRARSVRAVDGISLDVPGGLTVGLVGESGSGKTTLARAVVGLVSRTGGAIRFADKALSPGLRKRPKDVLCCLQIVFQDPAEALNPYLTVGDTLRRPVMRLRREPPEQANRVVAELLEAVHLSPEYASRLPGQLSGGQKQRVAIARAFAPNPSMVIADEPVSSLDVSVQASILNLLGELQSENGVSSLFISHDLAVVGYLADVIAVIYLGELMEVGPAEAVFDPPYHPYTEALLSSVPLIDPQAEQREVRLEGEVPSPAEEITGCPFHSRCPRFLGALCQQERPPWRDDATTGKRYFCHIAPDDLIAAQEKVYRFSDAAGPDGHGPPE